LLKIEEGGGTLHSRGDKNTAHPDGALNKKASIWRRSTSLTNKECKKGRVYSVYASRALGGGTFRNWFRKIRRERKRAKRTNEKQNDWGRSNRVH